MILTFNKHDFNKNNLKLYCLELRFGIKKVKKKNVIIYSMIIWFVLTLFFILISLVHNQGLFFYMFYLQCVVSGCLARVDPTAQGLWQSSLGHNPSLVRWENSSVHHHSQFTFFYPDDANQPQEDGHNHNSMVHSITAWHLFKFV